MNEQEKLNWLVENTTVKWVEKFVVAGEKVDDDRFLRDQGNPVSFKDRLEVLWQRKFSSFGDDWNEERQKNRFFYDAMKSFFVSFEGYRLHKVSSIEARENIDEKISQGDLAASYLRQMYLSGKKTIDLAISLGYIDRIGFVREFILTRNQLFEHNFNSNIFGDMFLEPSFFDVISTKSNLPIYVHTSNEREFEAFIDTYQDYYDLENIFVGVVEQF